MIKFLLGVITGITIILVKNFLKEEEKHLVRKMDEEEF